MPSAAFSARILSARSLGRKGGAWTNKVGKRGRLEQKIRQTGIVAVTTLRLLPIAPFTVVNIISGAFKVPLRDYILGSLLGLLPGILITNLFAHQFTSAIRAPGIGAFLVLAALIIITIVGTVWLKRRFES